MLKELGKRREKKNKKRGENLKREKGGRFEGENKKKMPYLDLVIF